MLSPPSRRRGLKSEKLGQTLLDSVVASLAEAWIEIVYVSDIDVGIMRRLPRGGVD